MSSSGESIMIGNILSGTEVAKYVLISYIHVYILMQINKNCVYVLLLTVMYWSSVQQ
jgi:hypothetical protein